MRQPTARAWRFDVGPRLERGVRPHSCAYVPTVDAACSAPAGAGSVAAGEFVLAGLQFADFSIQNATFPTKATLPETMLEATNDTAPPMT